MTSRGERRTRKMLKRKRIANVVLNVWCERSPVVLRNMIHNADNPKICNGPCCKNPRRCGWLKANGRTRKELMPVEGNE